MTKIIGPSAGLQGHYTLIKRKAATNEIVQELEFDNLITDAGLDALSTYGVFAYFFAGTGTAAPAVTDTKMATFRGAVAVGGSNAGPAPTAPDYFVERTYTGRFAANTVTGTLTEIGIGWGGTSQAVHLVFSRALIVDGSGNPTTITVLADEVLDVIYRIRLYPNLADVTSTVDIQGVTYTTVTRPANITSATLGGYAAFNAAAQVERVYSGSLGAITTTPSGTSLASGANATTSPYAANSLRRTGINTFPLGQSNLAGGIKSMTIYYGSPSPYNGYAQMEFTPAIPKDNTKVLTLQLSYTWGRRP